MSKKAAATTTSILKLLVPAGQAAPTPPVGPALGQRGLKAVDFCRQFNAQTAGYLPGTPLRVRMTVYPDRTFAFVTRAPPTSWLLRQVAGIEKGAQRPGSEVVGTISLKAVYELAKIKHPEMEMSLRGTCKAIVASARSAGIQVVP